MMHHIGHRSPTTELPWGGILGGVSEGNGIASSAVVWEPEGSPCHVLAMECDGARGNTDTGRAEHHVLGNSTAVELIATWLLDDRDCGRRGSHWVSEISRLGNRLELIGAGQDHERPILFVLGASGPTGDLKDCIEILVLEGPILVVAQCPETDDETVCVVHKGYGIVVPTQTKRVK